MKILAVAFICIQMLCSSVVLAQRTKTDDPKNQADAESLADVALQEGKFEKALLIYRELLEKNQNSPLLNFLVGYCYLSTDYGLDESIDYLAKAISLNESSNTDPAPIEVYYYMARAYHLSGQFNKAINTLDALISKIQKNDKTFIEQAKRLKEVCENAAMISQTQANLFIENVFEINSKYSDLNPILFNNGQEVVFSSRKESQLLKKKLEDDQYEENIYYSKNDGEEWSVPYGISKSINTINHESVCWISEKGDKIIFSRLESSMMKLYQATKNSVGEWSVPTGLPEPLNGRSQQTFASISPDGKYIYFTSDRKGGYGGTDIYVSEILGENVYGPAKNLGPSINTPYNEESPVMHENGVLFFSSEGHLSMGGFDIFASYRDNSGNWIEAFNMGVPVNTVDNDFFYKPISTGQYTLISSSRIGTKGKSDIFRLSYVDSVNNGYAVVAGQIHNMNNIEANKTIEISIKNNRNTEPLLKFKPNSKGYFNFILPAAASYQLSFLYQGKSFYNAKIDIEKSRSFFCLDQSVYLKNVNFNKDNLQPINESLSSIEKTTKLIQSSPLMVFTNRNDTTSADNDNISNSKNNKSAGDSIYSIKIVTSKTPLPLSDFKETGNVKEYIDNNGNYIYYTGTFNYEWEALIQLKTIKEKYPDASIFVNDFVSELSN